MTLLHILRFIGPNIILYSLTNGLAIRQLQTYKITSTKSGLISVSPEVFCLLLGIVFIDDEDGKEFTRVGHLVDVTPRHQGECWVPLTLHPLQHGAHCRQPPRC